MDGRKRTVQIKFRVTEAERDLILEKMKLVPTRNMAAYLRKIAIDGYIIQVDHEAAAKALKTAGITKLPNPATLQKEYEALQAQKEALYADYGKLKKKVREYDVIKQNIDSILQTGKQLADRGLFLLRQLLCGKFLKSCGQHVSVAPFEKHKVAGRAFRRVLFQRKVDTVLFRRTLKGFDIALGNLNVGNARVLLHKLLQSLFALRRFVFLLLHLCKQRFHSLLKRLRGQFPGLDVKGYGLFVDFILHLPSSFRGSLIIGVCETPKAA